MNAPSLGHGRRLPALDGLRGLAILLVVAYHSSWLFSPRVPSTAFVRGGLLAGWPGVDLFFVLSGYLVTGGLLAGGPIDAAAVRRFLVRRGLRILPLYYLALTVGVLVIGKVDLFHWIYLQNYSLPFADNPRGFTAHFWSLAVEEQFYLTWPLFLWGRQGLRSSVILRDVLLVWIAVVIVRAAVVFVNARYRWVDGYLLARLLYRATPFRLDGLLGGAWVAVVHRGGKERRFALDQLRRFRTPVFVASALGLVAVVASTGFASEDRRVAVLGYPLLALFFSMLVSWVVDAPRPEDSPRWLRHPLLVACGRLSYGLYVVHWPLISVVIPRLEARHALLGTQQAWLTVVTYGSGLFAVTYLVAWLSFRTIERPLFELARRFE
jgi:peptidoglycan/LPS O-acetylase OafA/YrhL